MPTSPETHRTTPGMLVDPDTVPDRAAVSTTEAGADTNSARGRPNRFEETSMGLLDGLLGQVLGGMAQGGQRGSPGTGGLEDLLNQLGGGRPSPGMGGLGDLLNQMGGMPGMPGGGMGVDRMPASGRSGGLGGAAIGALAMLALQLLQRNGGLGNVLGRLQQQGHGREADSWVSDGDNLPITPDAVSQIFGRDEIGRAAQQMGMSPEDAAGGLASIFPDLVNEITPRGRTPRGRTA